MNDFVFFITFFSFIILMFSTLRLVRFPLNQINTATATLYSLFLFSYLGNFPLYFQFFQNRVDDGISEPEKVIILLLYNILVFSTIIGVYLLLTYSSNNQASFTKKEVDPTFSKKNFSFGTFLFLIITVIVFLLYLQKIDKIALFEALKHGSKSAEKARSLMGNNFSGKYHRYKVFFVDILNFISYAYYAKYLINKNFLSKILFLFTFILCVFIAIFTTQKGPLLFLIIGYFIVYIIIEKRGKIPLKESIPLFLIICGLVFFSYILFMNTRLDNTIYKILNRTLTGQLASAYYYIEYFPNIKPFLNGLSMPNFHLLPHESFPLTKELMIWKHPSLVEEGIVGSMPAPFWGEGYANYGVFGIFIFSVIVGCLIAFIELIFKNIQKTPLSIGLYAWTILHYKDLALSGLFSFIFDYYFISVLISFFLIKKIDHYFLLRKKESCL